MECPKCALYHPPRYQHCISCGTGLVPESAAEPDKRATKPSSGRRRVEDPEDSNGRGGDVDGEPPRKTKMPTFLGIAISAFIFCAAAGVTIFFCTKPPENERLYQEGQKQLALGQYAFALKTLNEAVKANPKDPKALLALARACVGVDQVDKAWDYIVQAQQLGAGVVAEPQLASDLANYYRQRGQYERAVELLRPLANNNVNGKKAELADLDAAWGDQSIEKGDLKLAMRCWEEVKEMHEGSRSTEADSRLSTIYQKIAEEMMRKGDDDEALKYYVKLDTMAPSATSYERTADLYEKQEKYELAIDQMRKAVKLTSDASILNHKLARMMALRGKQMLDAGESDSGYGYLQEAQALDPRMKAPSATIRNTHVGVEQSTPHISGDVWNPGPDPLNVLSLRIELFDRKSGRVLWTKDERIIDEFVPPLPAHEAKSFDYTPAASVSDAASAEFRVYLNGALYRSYPLGKGKAATSSVPSTAPSDDQPRLRPRISAPDSSQTTVPAKAPAVVPTNEMPTPAAPNADPGAGSTTSSPEEKTLKDLD